MHTFLAFFAWPDGGVWSNVLAMPLCGVLAAVAAYLGRNRLGAALRPWLRRHFGHHAELDQIGARLDAHADLLDTATPGGMAAVMSEVRDVKAAAEAGLAEVRALARIARAGAGTAPETAPEAVPPPPAGGPGTSGRKARAPSTGTKVTPKRGGATPMQKRATGKAEGS